MSKHNGRRTVNLSTSERVGRIIVGFAGVVAGTALIAQASTALAAVLWVLLIVAGLDLVVTGARGYCPLYARLGHIPRSLRRQS